MSTHSDTNAVDCKNSIFLQQKKKTIIKIRNQNIVLLLKINLMDPEENRVVKSIILIWVTIRYSPHQGRENFFR